MKKIYISESSVAALNKERMLPKFLFKLVKNHATSLGDNRAFPMCDDYPFDYVILKRRYSDVCDAIEGLGLDSLDEDYLMTELSHCIKVCKEMEKPIRDTLEKICENAVNRLFAIPSEMINLTCKLVDKVTFKNDVRIKPESRDNLRYSFKDINDIDLSNKAVEKRRFINALIQGASYTYAKKTELYEEDLNRINPDLIPLYDRITTINDYLLFVKKEEMSDEKPMQGSYCETHIENSDDRVIIESQGIIFPLLLHDTIKGFFELFSSHGLPKDKQKACYVIKKADFILAEPWDMRLGVEMWDMLFGDIEDTNIIPYLFTEYIKLPTDKFNEATKEMLSNTEKGHSIMQSMIDTATYDAGYESFKNRINARNVNKSVINDSYFTAAELNGLELDGDAEEDGDVIEEDDFDEGYDFTFRDRSSGLEKYYRGVRGNINVADFGVDRKYSCTWLSDNPYYAAQYAAEYDDGHLYEVTVDMSKYNGYDWTVDGNDYFDPYDGYSREEEKEFLEQGYNGYTFAIDDGDVMVLFEPSPIVDVKELEIDKYLEDDDIR